jgi:hypothetical protein
MDWDEITLSANLCLFSYDDFIDKVNKEALKLLGIDVGTVSVHQVKNTSATVSFSKSLDTLYITWRGTDQVCDWLNNININPLPARINGKSIGKVHAGLWKYYEELRQEVNIKIDDFVKLGGSKIVFSGYSLGASVCFSAIETKQRLVNVDVIVYLFASPKLGNTEFMNVLNKYCWRFLHIIIDQDIIPTLPYFSQFVSFQKTYKLKTIDNNTYHNWIIKLLDRINYSKIYKNHAISNYVNILNTKGKKTAKYVKYRNSLERNSKYYENISNYNLLHTFDSRITIKYPRLAQSA